MLGLGNYGRWARCYRPQCSLIVALDRRRMDRSAQRVSHRRLSRQLAAVLHSSEADKVIAAALEILHQRARFGSALTSPGAVRDYLRLSLADRAHEVFVATWLDAQHRVI